MQEVLGNTVNGTTYAGLRARTTGAPQNHWWVHILYFLFFLFIISFTPMRTLPSTYIYQNDDVTQVWTSWRSAGRWHRDPGGNKARLVLP